MSQALLSVVAIVSAGVLVRLARGVPFSAIDVLEAGQAEKLSAAIKQSVRALGGLLLVCFLTTLCLIFVGHIAGMLRSAAVQDVLPFTESFDYVAFVVSFLLAFVFMRTFAVVRGDIQIVDIQADILTKTRNRKAAEEFQKDVADPASQEYHAPENYGGVIDQDQTRT